MANAISLPYSTSSGVYGTTLSSTYEWYVQWYQYPTNTSKVTSSANMKINSIAQKQSAEKRNLPDGYVQLEYIQSSGTQYIDTKFMPNQDTRVVIGAVFNEEVKWLFGARHGARDRTFGFLIEYGEYRSDYGTAIPTTSFSATTSKITVDKNKNVTSINGNVLITATEETFQCSHNLYLFANNNNGTVAGHSSSKIYSCQIYDNGTLIRDYVPCMNSNGIVGLYDLVANEFYTNAGTGEFIGGNMINVSLPSGYIRLQYVESTGNEYIDTGVVVSPTNYNKLRLVYDMHVLNTNATNAWAVSGTGTSGSNAFHMGSYNNTIYYGNGKADTSTGVAYDYTRRYWVNDASTGRLIVGGLCDISYTPVAPTISQNLYLFGYSHTTQVSHIARFYSCQIYEDGILIRSLIPCLDADNIAGMYDIVNDVFYPSTGSLVKSKIPVNDSGINVNISIYSKNAITRTGTSGYTCSTFTFKSQPTILLHNKTLGESVEVYDMALTTTVADNGTGTAVSGSIVHASTLDVTVPSSWFIEENRQWYFTISDLITIVDTGVTHTNTKTFDTFVVDALYNVWVKKSIVLPEGYTQLKYIESTGTQYVDTGFIPTSSNVKIVCEWIDTDTVTGKVVFGSGDDTNKGYCVVYENKLYIGDGNISNINVANIGSVNNLELSIQDDNTWKYSINGLFYSGAYTGSINKSYSLYIFNQSPFTNRMRKMKLFVFKIYDNNILVRNFIPCLNPSNVAGLYDLVNGVFYNDASGGVFNYPAISYTPVEYLESSGTQYVDTNFISNQDTSVEFEATALSIANATTADFGFVPFGSAQAYNSNAFEMYTWEGNFQCNYGVTSLHISSAKLNTKAKFLFDKGNIKIEYSDGEILTGNIASSIFTTPYAMTVFGSQRASMLLGKNRIYWFKVYDNGNLVRDFIPVLDSNNVACLYDKVSETFFYNKGTGTFTTGSTIGDSIIVPNSNTTLHKAIQIYVKKNGTLFPMTNMYAKVGESVVS